MNRAEKPADTEPKPTRLQQVVATESMHWGSETANTYHAAATRDMQMHWERYIAPIVERHPFDLDRVIDFAAGYGRNTRKLLDYGAKHITMVDVNPDCVAHLKLNMEGEKARVFQNDGHSLNGLESEAYTFLYTFDAMVHFDLEIILSYIPEFARVLSPGAYAFVHHSNYTGNPGGDFRQSPHWRNFMSADIFKHLAKRSGFEVVEQSIVTWGIEELDCITVMRRL